MAAANVRKFVIFCSFLALGTCVSILLMNLLLSRISKQALELIGSADITITPNQKNKTLLLLYNEFFGNKEWMTVNEDCSAVTLPRTGAKPCLKDNFEITSDKSRFYESDFVMVHVSSNLPSLHHLKTVRRQKPYVQLWIFYTMESPRLSPDVKRFTDLFDLTFTYRVDSDFWATYGSYEEIPFVNLSQQDFSAGKSKLVAWVVSNCQPYLRKAVVHELQKHITIDIYGRCSGEFGKRRSCPGGTTCRDIIRQYKFYLSFENALCEDYITEKYWRHLGKSPLTKNPSFRVAP